MLADYIQDEAPTFARRGAGVFMAILMLLLFPFFVLTACPFCVRCRICRPKNDPRSTNIIFKLLGLAAVAGVGIGIFVCWGYAAEAHSKMGDGISNLGCTSAKLVDATLEGQADPNAKFIGMNCMVDDFQSMAGVLDSGSPFVSELNAMIDGTEDIDASLFLATQTLSLLADMMTIDANSKPGGFHTCDFCNTLGTELAPAQSALAESLGSALADARKAAKDQLDEQSRADMKDLLEESMQPVRDIKDQIRDAFEPVVDSESWDTIVQTFDSAGLAVVMLLVALAAVLGVVAFLSMSCFLIKEGDNVSGYNRIVHRSACCTWVCAWLLCLVCFLLGGLIELSAIPTSSTCLVLDDVSGDMIRDIQKSLELTVDPDSDNFVMLTDTVDKCLNPKDPSVPAHFADILFTRDDNGTKTSMRQQLQSGVEDAINSQFDKVAEMIKGGTNISLENEPTIADIRGHLRDLGPNMSRMIISDRDAIQASGESWVGALPLWKGYLPSSVDCDAYTPPGSTVELPGVKAFIAQENNDNSLDLNFPNPPCSDIDGDDTGDANGVGSDCSTAADANACSAANWLLKEKYDVMTRSIFRCDVFETDSGDACDVKDMVQTSVFNNYWSNDCLRTGGTLRRKQVSCNLEEFTQYVADFDIRIQKTMARVDATTSATADQINGKMRDLLQTEIIDPITAIIDGIQCNFLAEYYRETVWGLCYQGVVGLNSIGSVYVALGFLLLGLIVIMYALWRRAVDNVKLRDAKLNN